MRCFQCTACCRWGGREEFKPSPKLEMNEHGNCVHLNTNPGFEGCDIYEDRPQECRDFDCRVLLENVPHNLKAVLNAAINIAED